MPPRGRPARVAGSRGTNTPLKIIVSLRSGKAIVATRLLTHAGAQRRDGDPDRRDASRCAHGILAGLTDHTRAATVGRQARELAETNATPPCLERTRRACAALMPAPPAGVAVKDVA